MATAMLDHRLVRFLLAGGLAAGANFGSRFLFSLWFRYEIAIALAYLVGMTVAFVLMRSYVFDGGRKAIAPQIFRFTVVNAVAALQTLLISVALARWVLPALGLTRDVEAIAHLVGVLVPVATSYVGHRLSTFR
jgi:putative flippase GtrA